MGFYFQTKDMTAGLMEPNSNYQFHNWKTENFRTKRY